MSERKEQQSIGKRDLRVLREIMHEGDIVIAKPDGSVVIFTGKLADALAETMIAKLADASTNELDKWLAAHADTSQGH